MKKIQPKSNPNIFVGVDVSSTQLDLLVDGEEQVKGFDNTEAGRQALLKRLKGVANPWVVLEATGGYQDLLVEKLQEARIVVSTVNPRQVRDFAKACGQLAKTDALDARAILHFAKAIPVRPDNPPSAEKKRLKVLNRRRQQLVEHRSQELKRRRQSHDPLVIEDIDEHLSFLNERIKELDLRLREATEKDAGMSEQSKRLRSVPGVGPVLATTLLAELPELGKASPKEIAALVGLAPFNHDSGKHKGTRKIRGGRTLVRTILYCATAVAVRCNPVIKSFFDRLIAAGKLRKTALIAAARKLLVILNAMTKNQSAWNFPQPNR